MARINHPAGNSAGISGSHHHPSVKPPPLTAALLGAVVLIAALSAGCNGVGGPDGGRAGAGAREFTLVSYNVHNLFDDRDDGTEFAGYRPGSDSWSSVEFHTKAERTADALRRIAGGGHPDIVALQEIENEHALGVLLREYLPRSGYRWFVMPPAGGSAFRVAAVSRFAVRSARVHAFWYLWRPQRDVLELELDIHGRALTLLVNHWPSKRGGAERTAAQREFVSAGVARRVRALQRDNHEAAVAVAGDFNMDPHEFSAEWAALSLYNPWVDQQFPGSYRFRGSWSRIDNIFLSRAAHQGVFELLSFTVVTDKGFLDRTGAPRVWFPGSSGGYSDHLPLRARLRMVP